MELNQSEIKMLMQCPEKWHRRYGNGEKKESTVSALRGLSIHRAIARNFAQKIKSRKDMKVNQFEELAITEFREAISTDGCRLTDDEKKDGEKVVLNEAQHQVKRMARIVIQKLTPKYQPSAVEVKHRFQLPSGVVVHGTLDVETEDGIIPDWKTTIRRPNIEDVKKSIQPTMYHMLYSLIHKKLPKAVNVEFIIDTSKGVETQTIPLTKTKDDYTALLNLVDAAANTIKAQAFVGAYGQEGAWWCAKRWCSYWTSCPFVPKDKR